MEPMQTVTIAFTDRAGDETSFKAYDAETELECELRVDGDNPVVMTRVQAQKFARSIDSAVRICASNGRGFDY